VEKYHFGNLYTAKRFVGADALSLDTKKLFYYEA
jgi:hypothetical protein